MFCKSVRKLCCPTAGERVGSEGLWLSLVQSASSPQINALMSGVGLQGTPGEQRVAVWKGQGSLEVDGW